MSLATIFQKLTARLYPRSRAFKLPPPDGSPPDGGDLYRLHRAINLSNARTTTAATDTFKALLPDNDGFTIDDAHAWYIRLGIYDSGAVPLADMKLAIAQKLSFPLVPLDKQSPEYIEEQLQAAGFNVYVYRNRFYDASPPGYYTLTPSQVLGTSGHGTKAVSGFCCSGQVQSGQLSSEDVSMIVNYLEAVKDGTFDIGSNYKSTFFVGGIGIRNGDFNSYFADVDINREIEFRQLLMKLKAANMVGFLFINYV